MIACHESVLLKPAINGLAIKPDGFYVDATFGRGGHSQAILQQLNSNGRLMVFDKDPDAIKVAKQLAEEDGRVTVIHQSFSQLEEQLQLQNQLGCVDGILADLGVSSPQLDEAERGFSFLHDGPLDMRMDPTRGISAADWLNSAKAEEIAEVLKDLGEERFARRIAQKIVSERESHPLQRTAQLAELISQTVPKKEMHKHPATRSFQAIRIFINQELTDLGALLQQSLSALKVGGRLVVISFHSLEDRLVKRFMKPREQLPRKLPVKASDIAQSFRQVGKAIKADEEEIGQNRRARSAVLRIGEKLS